MKFHLACSGGFANLRLEGQVDTSELAEDLAHKIEAAFAADQLTAAQAAKASPFMMDSQQYDLTVLPQDVDGEARKYRLDDGALSDDMLDVLDELRGLLVRRMANEQDKASTDPAE